MLTLTYSKLKKIAYPVLGLPFIVFAIGWMKWYWAVVAVVATLLCIYFGALQKEKRTNKKIVPLEESSGKVTIKYWVLILIAFVALIWVWQSGMGGFWAQSKDYPWRNAIYRDIVTREWPVYYEKLDSALCYYIGFWLPPALLGKIAMLMGANAEAAFSVASVAVFFWAFFLVVVLFGLLLTLLRADTTKKQLFVVFGFIFFSGLDILGSIEPLGANLYHLEWWADDYQYSSFTTCLFWVFNQSLIVWIAFACLLQEKRIRNYVFLGMMCLFSGPLPFLGFFVYCIALGVWKAGKAVQGKEVKNFCRDIVSPSNMLATVFVFIFIGTYLLSNAAISGANGLRVSNDSGEMIHLANEDEGETQVALMRSKPQETQVEIPWDAIGNYVLFVLFEFGIYTLLIGRKYYKKPLFWVTTLCLLGFPFIKIGHGSDFPMRASIPALFYLYYLVMKFCMEEKHWLKKKGTTNRMLYLLLIGTLVLGSITPCVEFYRGCRQVALYGLDNPMEDYLYTLSGDSAFSSTAESAYDYSNFMSAEPSQHFFYKYFGKEMK